MTTEYHVTPEERAFDHLIGEQWGALTEEARAVLKQANWAAYAECMVRNYCFSEEEYEEATEKMCIAAAGLTDREHKVLARIRRAALDAASSLDSEDFETPAGFRVHPGDVHQYYRMLSDMVKYALQNKRRPEDVTELQKKLALRTPADDDDLPL